MIHHFKKVFPEFPYRNIQQYFLSGMAEKPLETRKKMEHLLRFNLIALAFFGILIVIRIFGTSNGWLLAGDFNLLLILGLSLLMMRLNKPKTAAGAIYLIPVSILLYHVIENHFLGITITTDSIYASLAFLIFGIMFIGAFAVHRKQIVIYGIISLLTILVHYGVMTTSHYGVPADRESQTILYTALLIICTALLAAFLTWQITHELLGIAEHTNRKTEDKYFTLFSSMMDCFSYQKIIVDESGVPINSLFLEVNTAFEKFTGLSRSEIIGRYATDIIPEFTSPAKIWLNTFANVALTGKEARIEEYSPYFRRWLCIYVFSPEPGYFVTLLRDITQSHETAEALKRSEQKNKAIIDALPDHVIIIDENGNIPETIQGVNTPGKKLDTSLSLNLTDLSYPPETANRLIASAKLALTARTLQTIDYEITHDQATTYFEARIIALSTQEVLILNRNITDRKSGEISLRNAKEKAEESDRLKTAFLANISHEVLTPMNAIMGFSQMLIEHEVNKEDCREFAGLIRLSGQMLIGLINDIMDLARIEAGETRLNNKRFGIAPLLNELQHQYRIELLKKGKTAIDISVDLSNLESPGEIETDRSRLQQVLSNLLDNAVKFTQAGSIKFGCCTNKPGTVTFFVRDTGIGISGEKQKIIFERFRQVEEDYNRTYGGTGIGLALVKKITELLGGQISLESTYGLGSAFSFTLQSTLPDQPQQFIPPPEENKLLHNYNWSGKTILITEDIYTNFILLQHLLIRTKAEVLHAINGKKAVDLVTNGKHIDLILMDLQMPEMNGIDAFKEIRKIKPEIKVILQTAFAGDEDRILYYEMGFDGFITKPIRIETIMLLIDNVLNPQTII